MAIPSITQLGEIKVHDDGDGVIDLKKDKVTGLHNDTPIDSFDKDPRVQMVMKSLGVKSLQGVALSPAVAFMTKLSEVKGLARGGYVKEVRDELRKIIDLAHRNHFGFSEEAAHKIFHDTLINLQSRLEKVGNEAERRMLRDTLRTEKQSEEDEREIDRRWGKDLSPTERAERRSQVFNERIEAGTIDIGEVATVREKVRHGKYDGKIDALQKLFGTNLEMSEELKERFNRLPAVARFDAWSAVIIEQDLLGLNRQEFGDLCGAVIDGISQLPHPTQADIDNAIDGYKRRKFGER